MEGIPRGGKCSYCSEKDNCIDLEAAGECRHFRKTETFSDQTYNGSPEPILIDGTLQYIEVESNGAAVPGSKLALRRFGEFKCQRCDHITHIPQPKNQLIVPFECESDQCGKKGPFKRMFSLEIMNPPWKPATGIIETDPYLLYSLLIDFLHDSIYFENPAEYTVFALWIMASWVPESFDSSPYLMFIAPKDSGKTRGLDIISELGYRPIPAVSFSSSSMFRAVNMWSCTLLVDEAEYQINAKTEKGQDLYAILNGGYKRGMYAIRTSTVDDTYIPMPFNIFGFKALAATRPFNSTLESRCVIFHMEQHEIKNLLLPKEDCEDLRNRLLFFRFSSLQKIPLVFPEKLKRGRIIELFTPLYSIASLIEKSIPKTLQLTILKELDTYIEETYSHNIQEDNISQIEPCIIHTMLERFDSPNNDAMIVSLKDIYESIRYEFPTETKQHIGIILKAMGFDRRRSHIGTFVDLSTLKNKQKLDQYIERYKIL